MIAVRVLKNSFHYQTYREYLSAVSMSAQQEVNAAFLSFFETARLVVEYYHRFGVVEAVGDISKRIAVFPRSVVASDDVECIVYQCGTIASSRGARRCRERPSR